MRGILLAAAALLGAAAPEGGVLEGRVVDEAGNPVEGAAILVLPAKEGEQEPPAEFAPPAVPRPGDPGDRVPVWERSKLRADREGRFRVEGLEARDHWILASLPGMDESWERARPGRADLVLKIPGPRTISGVCVEAGTEQPIAGMEFWIGPEYGGGMVWLQKQPTDAEGRFRIDGLLPGSYRIVFASSGGFHPRNWEHLKKDVEGVKAGATDVRVVLDRGQSLSGKVVDDRDRPVAGVTVEVAGQGEMGGWRGMGSGTAVRSGPDGAFRISGLEPGLYGIRVAGDAERAQQLATFARMDRRFAERNPGDRAGLPKRSADDEEIEANERVTGATVERLRSGTADVVVRVRRAARITGRVADGEGHPLSIDKEVPLNIYAVSGPFAGSNLLGTGSSRGGVLEHEDKVMPDGSFRTRALDPEGEYDLLVLLPGGKGSGAARGVRPGTSGVEVRLRRGGELSGTLVDPGGGAVGAGVPVRAVATGLAESGKAGVVEAVTGEGGAFVLRGLGESSYRLEAGGGVTPWIVTAAPGEFVSGETGVRVAARPGAVLAGRIVDEHSRAVLARFVVAGAGPTFPVGEDGSFVVGGLAPGKVRISAWVGDREVDFGEFEAPSRGLLLKLPADWHR